VVLPNCLLPVPPVQLLGAVIPIGDDVLHVADENRVVRQIEEAGLLAQLRLCLLALGSGPGRMTRLGPSTLR